MYQEEVVNRVDIVINSLKAGYKMMLELKGGERDEETERNIFALEVAREVLVNPCPERTAADQVEEDEH